MPVIDGPAVNSDWGWQMAFHMADAGLLVQVRVYTKKVGHKPDFSEPVVLTFDR